MFSDELLYCAQMSRHSDQDQYTEQEAQQRLEKLVKAALNTHPKPLRSMIPEAAQGAVGEKEKAPFSEN
jgi:hypothetical protein